MDKWNYLTIQEWMPVELKLKGNELIIFALIYGFTQNREGSLYTGSANYIAKWINSDKKQTIKILKRMVEKGLILKHEKILNGYKFCDYEPNWDLISGFEGKKYTPGVENTPPGVESTPHNIEYTIGKESINSIITVTNTYSPNNTIYTEERENFAGKISPEGKPYESPEDYDYYNKFNIMGEFKNVYLTYYQLDKLMNVWFENQPKLQEGIEILSDYIESTGKKYKNHYAVLRKNNWVYNKIWKRESR